MNQQNNVNNIDQIISIYKNFRNFDLQKASPEDINKTIKCLNSKKATSPDNIPPKLVKLAARLSYM